MTDLDLEGRERCKNCQGERRKLRRGGKVKKMVYYRYSTVYQNCTYKACILVSVYLIL